MPIARSGIMAISMGKSLAYIEMAMGKRGMGAIFFDPGCDLPGTKAVLFRRPTRLTCGTLTRRTGTG